VKLTEKQARFVAAYVGPAKGNGTEAARQAGYSGNAKTLESMARENLAKPGVRQAIDRKVTETRSAETADIHEATSFLTGIMRATEGRTPIVTDSGILKDETGEPITNPPSTKERVRSAEILLRAKGAFIDKIEVKTTDAIEAQLRELERRMPAAAFEALIEALAGDDPDDDE
jgi:phage terminase small subunit